MSGKHLLNLVKVKCQRIFYPASAIVLLQVFCFDLFSWPSPQAPREQVDIYAVVPMPVIRSSQEASQSFALSSPMPVTLNGQRDFTGPMLAKM